MLIIKCPKCASRDITQIAGIFSNSSFEVLSCSDCGFLESDYAGAEKSLAGFLTRFMTAEFCSEVLAELLEHRNRFDFSTFCFARQSFEAGRIKNAEVVRKVAELMNDYQDERSNSVRLANEKKKMKQAKAIEKSKETRMRKAVKRA